MSVSNFSGFIADMQRFVCYKSLYSRTYNSRMYKNLADKNKPGLPSRSERLSFRLWSALDRCFSTLSKSYRNMRKDLIGAMWSELHFQASLYSDLYQGKDAFRNLLTEQAALRVFRNFFQMNTKTIKAEKEPHIIVEAENFEELEESETEEENDDEFEDAVECREGDLPSIVEENLKAREENRVERIDSTEQTDIESDDESDDEDAFEDALTREEFFNLPPVNLS